jgi:serine/threonine-protein kinase RsbT
MTNEQPYRLDIRSEADIVEARTRGKDMARQMGFGLVDQTRIATGISELARNILQYAKAGKVSIEAVDEEERRGLQIVAEDQGPGIADVNAVLEGRGPARGLGLGIPGTRRLMDEFRVTSAVGQGTRIQCVKWLP